MATVPFLAPEPLALGAELLAGDLDRLGRAPGGLDSSISSFISRSWPGRGPAAALAEEVAEEAAAEDVAEGRHDVFGVAEVVDPRPFEPGVAVAVVPLALRLVGEDLVRLGRLLEPLLGLGVARVLVRVVLQGQLPIGLLDLVGRGVALHAEDFVIIALRGHRHGVSIGSVRGGASWPSRIPQDGLDATRLGRSPPPSAAMVDFERGSEGFQWDGRGSFAGMDDGKPASHSSGGLRRRGSPAARVIDRRATTKGRRATRRVCSPGSSPETRISGPTPRRGPRPSPRLP